MTEKEVVRVPNPFPEQGPAQTASALVESQRAVAEAIVARKVALANPRDKRKAMDLIITDCCMVELAEEATYDYARGGSDITGASIRLLETICRHWGNMRSGVKEIARHDGYSEVKTYAIDLETGFEDEKTFTVKHWRDTKKGGYAVTDERDIYEVVANFSARRKRACMETIIPPDVKDAAIRQCELTLKSKVEITPESIKNMLAKFEPYGIGQEHIEKRIQRKISAMTAGHFINLRKIFNSLKEGMSQPQDWFDLGAQPEQAGATKTENLAADLAKRAGPKKDPPPASADTGTPAKPETAADRADPQTGEITNATLRAAIERATAQADLTPIMMDIFKLPDDPARRETTKLWSAKVEAIKQASEPTKPAEAPPAKPAAKPAAKPPVEKPAGTRQILAELGRKMSAATTREALDEAANEISLYKWSADDANELSARYAQCSQDLDL